MTRAASDGTPRLRFLVALAACVGPSLVARTTEAADRTSLACIRAAEEGRSVSGMVAEYLRSVSGADSEFARLEAQQRRIQSRIKDFRAADRLTRDEIHERALR